MKGQRRINLNSKTKLKPASVIKTMEFVIITMSYSQINRRINLDFIIIRTVYKNGL